MTSSGEPTLSPLSVTKVLELISNCRKEGIDYSPIRMYSNGIRIGEDKDFCDNYLALWKNYGLTTVYVTIFDIYEKKNAKIYGRSSYPELKGIVSRLHDANLLIRGNIVVSKNTISTLEQFVSTTTYLKCIGVDYVSAWPIRSKDDKVDFTLSPLEHELDKIEAWIESNKEFGYKINLLREHKRAAHRAGKKLTLFPDGVLSDTWCND